VVNDLQQLAADLEKAAATIQTDAGRIVHSEATNLERQVRSLDGTSTRAVVTFPSMDQATIIGTETFGTMQSSSPLSGIDVLDVGAAGREIADELAAAGVDLIMGRR
jgi:hypothetical protein